MEKLASEWVLFPGLVVASIVFLMPLNLYLSVSKKKSLQLFPYSLLFALISWFLYDKFSKNLFESGHASLFLSAFVLVNFLLHFLSLRIFNFHEGRILEERIAGWFLFSPLLMVAVVITTPLFAAIFRSLIR